MMINNQDRKTVIAKSWTRANGKRILLPLMDNEYLKNAYRRCIEIIYGNIATKIGSTSRDTYQERTSLSKDKATEWKTIFEEEAKKRGISLPRINKDTYSINFGNRLIRRELKKMHNKNFDEKFK